MLRVKNITRNVMLIERGQIANTIWTRFRGLMGVRQLEPGQGLLISPCNSIHTHFMRIPIDVLYLNAQDRVVDIDAEMPTWRFGRLRRGVRYVIELPSGSAAKAGCAIGDQLQILAR
jgi:uncharacterized membrane protein (UPF0127 family)